MSLEHDAIRNWRFFRKDIPKELTNGTVFDVGKWGRPCANFQYDYNQNNCDTFGMFRNQALVSSSCHDRDSSVFANLDCRISESNYGFGFDPKYWKTNGYSAATKHPDCEDFVRENPNLFKTDGWELNSIKIYQHCDINDGHCKNW